MAQCVFCEATTNLNTQITITDDGGKKVAVDICDVHADDATPKAVRVAYFEKREKAEGLIAQLKAMGVEVATVTKNVSGLLVPTLAPKPQPKLVSQTTNQMDDEDGIVVDTAVLDAKSRKMASSTTSAAYGNGQQVSVGGHTSHDVVSMASSQLSPSERQALIEARKGQVKLTVMEGRAGQPLVLPTKRVDGMGTTRLKISKKEDDARLQARSKRMAQDSISNDRVPNFAREGYSNTQSDCPICHGACVIVQRNQETTCPKCNGAGVISVY